MIRKLKNKGYMLVEIILAFVLAIGVTYFMFELIIKLKNKNDDLIVKTLVATDQAIIYNTIMQDLITSNSFDCSNIEIENNKFKYNNEYVSDVSDYAGVGSVFCDKNGNNVSIKIPINVNQLKDTFDINIKYTLDEVILIWTRGYYVSTLGLNKQVISKYIRVQETENMV